MSDELIKRLREFHELRAPIPSVPSIATEAADLIEQQAARIAALESQLTAKTELATLYAASLRKVEGDGGGEIVPQADRTDCRRVHGVRPLLAVHGAD
jgi:hypothetical protein